MVCVIRLILAPERKCTYNGLCYQVDVGTWEEMHFSDNGLCYQVDVGIWDEMHLQWSVLSD